MEKISKKETTIQRIKRESKGKNLLDPEFEKREREETLAIWMRILSKRNSKVGLTEREEISFNI
jgi:hypothetical protein